MAAVSGGAFSDQAGNEMAAQPPGERHWSDYFLLTPAMVFAPVYWEGTMVRSIPGLVYAGVWTDPHVQFHDGSDPTQLAGIGVAALGLFPTALGLFGLALCLKRRNLYGPALPLFLYGGVLVVAFLIQTWAVPTYSAVKASYLLSSLLPVMLALTVGLEQFCGRARNTARAFLLAIAVCSTALTSYGWWM